MSQYSCDRPLLQCPCPGGRILRPVLDHCSQDWFEIEHWGAPGWRARSLVRGPASQGLLCWIQPGSSVAPLHGRTARSFVPAGMRARQHLPAEAPTHWAGCTRRSTAHSPSLTADSCSQGQVSLPSFTVPSSQTQPTTTAQTGSQPARYCIGSTTVRHACMRLTLRGLWGVSCLSLGPQNQ